MGLLERWTKRETRYFVVLLIAVVIGIVVRSERRRAFNAGLPRRPGAPIIAAERPTGVYVVAGVILAGVIGGAVYLSRRRRREGEAAEPERGEPASAQGEGTAASSAPAIAGGAAPRAPMTGASFRCFSCKLMVTPNAEGACPNCGRPPPKILALDRP